MFFFSECVRCLVPGPVSVLLRFSILLCLPAMIGGVVLVARLMKRGSARDRAAVAVAISGPVLMAILLVLTDDLPGRYSPLVLHKGPFNWPAGCADRKYNDGDEISITCHDYRNALPAKLVLDHGFRWTIGRGDKTYYRVGTDAVNFSCNDFKERCTVQHVEQNVFQ